MGYASGEDLMTVTKILTKLRVQVDYLLSSKIVEPYVVLRLVNSFNNLQKDYDVYGLVESENTSYNKKVMRYFNYVKTGVGILHTEYIQKVTNSD